MTKPFSAVKKLFSLISLRMKNDNLDFLVTFLVAKAQQFCKFGIFGASEPQRKFFTSFDKLLFFEFLIKF